ncbi:MAG TPA: 1-aminocyclopropane-1-carboxylate deaminase, partial [Sphingobacteriaceae bacterium]|nr:1-aminocyclopropane-1-carboxylate deaminase [Sphingobacteriaceae bacterium]
MIDLQFHSPVEQIYDPLLTEKQVQVFIKRDDLIHPFISGNKWRKLKYILQKAEQEKKDHLITFGGAWSNHLLATACAAAKFGFKSTGIIRGEDVNNNLLTFCKLFGMELKFTDRESYRDKKALFSRFSSDKQNAFFIDEGGAGIEAVKGCSELVAELEKEYDHIFCACGTGTTAAGILNGLGQINSKTSFHAVPVLKNGGFLREDIRQYLIKDIDFQLHTDYHFGGYAKTTQELIRFIKDFPASTGIMIDPVYTG